MKQQSKCTVLIVDDHSAILRALRLRLEHARYEVVAAGSSTAALQLAREHKPDIALLDVNLADGNGFDLADKIQLMSSKPVYKVFISASKDPALQQKADLCGAHAFLEKPFDSDDLFSALQSIEEHQFNLPTTFS